ncbi:MAG TPA: hypothetical protein VD735_03620 [Candidatus Saccharimonadales bacterium]|nr:hypothetical protein [Candidatus Saccharimonadales bacterium]
MSHTTEQQDKARDTAPYRMLMARLIVFGVILLLCLGFASFIVYLLVIKGN